MKIKKKCIYCSNLVKKNASKYCSPQCMQDFIWEERKKDITKSQSLNNEDPRIVRRYLLDLSNQCSICKNTLWNDQPIPLVVDHIDGNSENNYLNNLRLLCCNCDAQTPTYKSKNRGNGRHYRRQRYKEGKSF